jgi:AraC-like DNA-binding protein
MRRFGYNDLELVEGLFGQLSESPFFIKDLDLRYVAANRAMAALCGAAHTRDLYGKRATDFFPAPLAVQYEGLDHQVISTGRRMTNVLDRSVGIGGAAAWLLFARIPVRAADGSCLGVAATSRRLRQGLISEATYQRLQRVSDRLRTRFDQPLRLAQLATEAGTSASQLERDFRKLFSITPRDFLHELRLEEARRRLEESDESVSSIAHACGYADHSAFTRRFVQAVGTTPSKYRRQSNL